ncbi:MAG: hypothetical protein JXC36_00235 [Candidatus Atribacteria bacterium]|nr:hypothetical protein [Candidatus Atribacteria bacterium]
MVTSIVFYPSVVIRFWSTIDSISLLTGIRIVLSSIIAVLLSVFVFPPILFRSQGLVDDQKLNAILERMADHYGFKKIPGIYRIRTVQMNAIYYSSMNKHCIGLTSGILDAYRDQLLSDKDLEYIFSFTLFQKKNQNDLKRNLMFGIASFYKSMGYIVLFLGRGFLRIRKVTNHRAFSFFGYILGAFFILVGTILRVPEKIGSIFAAPLIVNFYKNADLYSSKIIDLGAMKAILQKINDYNQKIEQNLSLLAEPEYWLVQPVKLFKIDQLFMLRPSFEKRIQWILLNKIH